MELEGRSNRYCKPSTSRFYNANIIFRIQKFTYKSLFKWRVEIMGAFTIKKN